MQRRDILRLSACLGFSATSLSLSRALMAGVTADSVVAKGPLGDEQCRTIAILSDMIIPATDAPLRPA